MIGATEEDLIVFSGASRLFYQFLIYPVVSTGFIANLGVFVRLLLTPGKTTLKPFYRISLISLAFSDLLLLGSSGTNLLALVTSRTILWSLQEWSCTAIPFLQTIAVLVASLTLAGVAIDRFSAFKSKFAISKGPSWIPTVSYVLLVWTVAAAASYPVLDLYKAESLLIINNSTVYTGFLCVTNRQKAKTAYTGLFVVIFLPLTIIFLTIHVMLAMSISQRKGPAQCTRAEPNLSNENSTASTNTDRPRRVTPRAKLPTPTYVIRKRRTVRVILFLILIFAVCRLPQWSFLLFKLYATVSSSVWWHVQVILSTLSLLNAAMHPFLYAFLNEALSLVSWTRSICASRKSVNIDSSLTKMRDGSCSGSVKVPRGPYSP